MAYPKKKIDEDLRNRVIEYFKTNENNTNTDICIEFKISKKIAWKIIDDYTKTLKINNNEKLQNG